MASREGNLNATARYFPVDAAWLSDPRPEPLHPLLDFSRGVLRSLSFASDGSAREVHVLSFRHAFDELGAPRLYRRALHILTTLGEVETLAHGFLVITPYRLINLSAGRAIFIGALPAAELPFSSYELRGLARFVETAPTDIWPRQSLSTWAGFSGIPPSSLIEWVQQTHLTDQRIALVSGLTEFLAVAPTPRQFVWTRMPCVLLPRTGLAICREKSRYGTRYFFGTVRHGRLTHESPLRLSPSELLPAVAVAVRNPLRVKVSEKVDTITVQIPRPSPRPVRRALTLLGVTQKVLPSYLSVAVPRECYQALSALLTGVGYELEIPA